MLINSVLPGGGTDMRGDEATEFYEAPRPLDPAYKAGLTGHLPVKQEDLMPFPTKPAFS